MRKKIKSILVISLCLCVTFLTAACGSSAVNNSGASDGASAGSTPAGNTAPADTAPAASSDEKVKIQFYTWWADAEQEMGNALISAFEEKYPNIDVEPTYVAEADYLSKLNTLAAAKQMPDVYYLNEYLINDWGMSGISADLSKPFAELDINADDKWVDSALYKSGDAIYGINYGSTTIVMYYNKEMLKEAGVAEPGEDAKKPWTWEEYVNASIAMTKDMNGKGPKDDGFDINSCLQFGTTMTTSWIYWLPLVYAGGSSIADDTGTKLEITSDNAINTLQLIADLHSVNKCAPSQGVMGDGPFQNLPAQLMNGNVGCFIGGTFLLGNFTKENFDVGIAQIPTSNGAKASNMVWSSAFSMSSATAHPKEAALFVDFMADFDNTINVAMDTGLGVNALPSTKATLDPSTQAYANWQNTYNPTMAKAAAGILSGASRAGENVTLKNFASIMNETLSPTVESIYFGEKSAKDHIMAEEATLQGKLQGAW